jgi:hypothetical protein
MKPTILSKIFSALLLFGWIVGFFQPVTAEVFTHSQMERESGITFKPLIVAVDRFDVSPVLKNLTPEPARSGEIKDIPKFVRPIAGKASEGVADQSIVQSSAGGPITMPAPELNFEGVNNVNSVYPPDTQGDIGPNHYIQWVNLSFQIWSIDRGNHTATSVYGPAAGNTLWQGFGGACETYNHGDPITLYDPFADRWFMSQFAIPSSPPYYQCVAVSVTPDPLGAWYRYAFIWPNDKLNDYSKFGVWPDAYYMTTNQFDSSFAYQGVGVAALDREKMIAGQPASIIIFDLDTVNSNFFGMLPADFDGLLSDAPPAGAPALFIEWDDSTWLGDPTDMLRLWEFHVDWDTPANATFGIAGLPNATIPTVNVDPDMCNYARSCIPQPDTLQGLDAISDRLMYRLQYRNYGEYQTLVSNHTVDLVADHAGIHWFELRKSGTGAWSMYQEGVYAPDANNRWMASLALDHVGNLAVGYSVSSSTLYPSIRYAGRLADDPLGMLSQAERILFAGTGSQTGTAGRWGDYSMMGVDPTDDCTFWYTQEYIAVTGAANWRTRIGTFKFPDCPYPQAGELSVSPLALEATLELGSTAVQTMTLTNIGAADVGFEFFEIDKSLQPALGELYMDVPWLSTSPITGTIPGLGYPLLQPNETPFIPVIKTGESANPGLTTHSTTSKTVAQPTEPSNPAAILWDQPLSLVHQTAYINQEFPDFPTYNSFLADDFINDQRWNISTIYIPGYLWNGGTTLMNATALHWQIYADNSGQPAGDPSGGGSPPLWNLSLPPSDSQVVLSTSSPGGYLSNTTLNLNTPIDLPAGHYWLVFYPTMSFTTDGEYGRQPADTTNSEVGNFINPGGGFGYGTNWQAWNVLGPVQQDIAFRLEGQVIHNYQQVEVTFDAGAVSMPGIYYAELKINSDSPDAIPNVPVTMTVTQPATWGNLEGVVTSLGYCDQNPKPLVDAQVVIQPSAGEPITLTTDINGYFSFWLDQALSPLIVSASALDHSPETISGVVIAGEQTTTVNFNLHSTQPCYKVSLTPASDTKSGAPGDTIDYSLVIANTGSVSNNFTFAVSGNAWSVKAPAPVTLNAGASATVIAHVTIPFGSAIGNSDSAIITASGAGGVSTSSFLTTSVNKMKMYMPHITKNLHP